jgi:tryptophan-rich sensory protein
MWGVARWLVGQRGVTGRSASRWLVALMVGVILLPFVLAFANPFMTSLLSMLVLLTGIIAMLRTSAVSGGAALLLAPGPVWFGLGSLIGFTTLAGGWSPPFALVDHNKH